MERLAFLVAFSLVAITAPGAFCAKILFAYPIAVTSHTQVYEPIIEALGQRGHNVTVYAGLAPRREMPPNVNLHISKQLENVLSGDSGPLNNSFQTLRTPLNFKMIFNSFDWPRQWCEEIMQDPVYHNLWNASNDTVFDLVIVSSAFNECVYGLIWRDKLPFVLVSPTGMFPWVGYAIGNPSYVVAAPTLFLSSSSNRMNFMERLSNWAISVIYGAIYYWNSAPKTSNVLRQYFPEFPHPNEVTKNASLYLLNTDISMDYPRPLLPSVKEIGGLHCRSAQPLPEDLESFVTKPGSSGLIVFSLGSTVKGVHMPPQFRAVFTEVFRRLPEYQVLWKWESDQVEGVVLPPNVRLAKWLPQQDVLGHAATKLFITQGGLLSMHEATFHGVPIVGLPVGSDQLLNMRRAQEAGVGLALIWEELDADKLFTAVRTVLADDTFAANVQDRSKIMRDAEQGPLQRAVFWIEYVLRHGGAEHLKSSAPDLTWYQRNSLDVVAVAATVLAVGLSILLALVYFVVCRCLPSVIRRAVRGRKPKQE